MESTHFSPIRTWESEEGTVSLSFNAGNQFEKGIQFEIRSKLKTECIALEKIIGLPKIQRESTKNWSLEEISSLFAKCYPKVQGSNIKFIENCFEGMSIKLLLVHAIDKTTFFELGDTSISLLLGTDLNNSEIILEVNPIDTISQVVQKAKSIYKISVSKEMLFSYEGDLLDENKTLLNYEVIDGALLNECKKANKGDKSFSFNPCTNPKEVNFTKAPDWRTATRGLNLLGRCRQAGCKAQNEYVCIQKGFGEQFLIAKERRESKCPAAGTDNHHLAVDVNNLVFWDCDYKMRGYKTAAVKEFVKDGAAPRDRYVTFEENGKLDSWEHLEIKVTKR